MSPDGTMLIEVARANSNLEHPVNIHAYHLHKKGGGV